MRISDWSSDVCSSDLERLRGHNGRLGLRLKSDQSPAGIAEDLGHFQLVALEFPRFGDGRAYSYARLLRERSGFKGELRAVGNVLRDQFLFMLRCGFDAFEVANENAVDAWRSEEHTSELPSLMRISYAVFCLQTNKKNTTNQQQY